SRSDVPSAEFTRILQYCTSVPPPLTFWLTCRLWRPGVSDYLPLRRGPNAGGEMRRFEAASYADATRRIRSSAPGSARNTRESGRPGAGSAVGVLLLVGMYRFRSGLSVNVAS